MRIQSKTYAYLDVINAAFEPANEIFPSGISHRIVSFQCAAPSIPPTRFPLVFIIHSSTSPSRPLPITPVELGPELREPSPVKLGSQILDSLLPLLLGESDTPDGLHSGRGWDPIVSFQTSRRQ